MPKNLKILIHISFWILSIGTNFIVSQLPYLTNDNVVEFFSATVIIQLSFMSFFYINYSIIVPKFLITKKYKLYFLALIGAIAYHTICDAYLWNNFEFTNPIFTQDQLKGFMFSCMYGTFISTGLKMFDYWMDSEKRKHELEKEVKNTELLFLQSQMSPHFLFNTLNSIYSLSLKKSNLTSNAIAQLKDMMQYFEQFEKGEKISLVEEVNHIQSYISLNKMRYFNTVNFEYNITDYEENTNIEPMLFLPFIENAFKHGDTSQTSTFEINLNCSKSEINFSIKNKISENKRKDRNGGIGISNVKRRLELLFPNQSTLETFTNNNIFNVHLKLNIA